MEIEVDAAMVEIQVCSCSCDLYGCATTYDVPGPGFAAAGETFREIR